jgi:transposase-like protein
MTPPDSIDERTIELIANRVAAALKEELVEIAAQLVARDGAEGTLTVDDVAERFGVARSTVYAHWQEWGGYKLGDSAKAPIRFGRADLAIGRSAKQLTEPPPAKRSPPRRRRRRELISDAPRFDLRAEELE